MIDEESAMPSRRLVEPRVLDSFGIAELEAYIAALRVEIGRAEAMIERKTGHRQAVDALFGKKS